MAFNAALLKTQVQANSAKDLLALRKSDLEFEKLQRERQIERRTATATRIEADLTSTNAEISTMNTVIAELNSAPTPDAELIAEFQARLTTLNYRKFVLEQRQVSSGVVSILVDSNRLDEINVAIAEIDSNVAEIDGVLPNLPA
jgi:response regulator RpfG family c-di-GMP phosphodiesterase